VLGQLKTGEKSNEITAIPLLLEMVELRGCIVTIDARGCQTQIAEKIISREADYVLSLKGNQGRLHEEVAEYFAWAEKTSFKDIEYDCCRTLEKDHGRIEDVAFREDGCRTRTGHAPENLATLRHIAVNLLQQERSCKLGIKSKRLKGGWDESYMLKVLNI